VAAPVKLMAPGAGGCAFADSIEIGLAISAW
jgi:hypothetical protein